MRIKGRINLIKIIPKVVDSLSYITIFVVVFVVAAVDATKVAIVVVDFCIAFFIC